MVPCYALPGCAPRRLVFLLNFYLSKLPKVAFERDILYMRPKKSAPKCSETPWYDETAEGKNTLAQMTASMTEAAGIERKTNHSLRATGASRLFQNEVPEKIIQRTTGHRSVETLRSYEHISNEQHRHVSKVMMTNSSYDSSSSVAKKSSLAASVLGSMTNCAIHNFTVNINPSISVRNVSEEFDELIALADPMTLE